MSPVWLYRAIINYDIVRRRERKLYAISTTPFLAPPLFPIVTMLNSKRKKKILYIITKSNWGGAQHYVLDLATNLNPETVDVAVALGGNGELKKRLEAQQIRCIPLPFLERDINVFKEILLFFSLLKLYKSERPDIIHLNSSKIGGIGSLTARIYNLTAARKTKIIFTAHGWAFQENRFLLIKTAIWIVSWITALCCHTIIAVSLHDKKIAKMPFVSKKIVVIHNGIEAPAYLPQTHARKTILSFLPNVTEKERAFLTHPKTRWLGTIAELHPNKGLSYALYAINMLTVSIPNIAYIIIGEGEQRKDIEQYVREESLHNHIFLTGHIAHAAELISAFDILLLSSIKEGFPYVLLESAHAKIPTLATNVGGIPELIEHHFTGLLARPGNSKDLQDGLTYMLIESYRREKLGNNLYHKVTEHFTLNRMLEKTWELYRSILATRKIDLLPNRIFE